MVINGLISWWTITDRMVALNRVYGYHRVRHPPERQKVNGDDKTRDEENKIYHLTLSHPMESLYTKR